MKLNILLYTAQSSRMHGGLPPVLHISEWRGGYHMGNFTLSAALSLVQACVTISIRNQFATESFWQNISI